MTVTCTAQDLDERWLQEAIRLAVANVPAGGGPFGAVVVRDGRALGAGTNSVTRSNDPTAHAEVQAIRAACAGIGDFSLVGATLYCSCEPCPLCLAAALWARVARVVYAADREDAAWAGFDDKDLYDLLGRDRTTWPVPVVRRRLEGCEAPMRTWLRYAGRVPY